MSDLPKKRWLESPWTSAIFLMATMACFASGTACNRPEVPTSVKLSNGPAFSLSGSGRLGFVHHLCPAEWSEGPSSL